MSSDVDKVLKKMLKDARSGFYQVIILKIIAVEGPLHGYAVRKRIEELSNSTLEPSESTIYETLKKLEKLKLIEGFWAKSPFDGAPPRKYYRVTSLGLRVLDRIVNEIKIFLNITKRILEVEK